MYRNYFPTMLTSRIILLTFLLLLIKYTGVLARVPMQDEPPLPPATFYGAVGSGHGFTPVAGMTIQATINGNICAQSELYEQNSEILYHLNVASANSEAPGCGIQDITIVFVIVNDQKIEMTPTGVWVSGAVQNLPLNPVPPTPTPTNTPTPTSTPIPITPFPPTPLPIPEPITLVLMGTGLTSIFMIRAIYLGRRS